MMTACEGDGLLGSDPVFGFQHLGMPNIREIQQENES